MDMLNALRTRHVAALALALAVAACGSEDGKKPTTRPMDGDDGQGGDGEPADGEPSDGDPTDGEPTDGEPTDGEPTDGTDAAAELPYAVDNNYAVSGFMGAAENEGFVTAAPSDLLPDSECGNNRPPDAMYGHCHTFTYKPDPLGQAWAGVFWQYPESNWTSAGLAIEPGATEVAFQLRADAPVTLKFVAGLASEMGLGAEDWKRETDPITATTSWTKHKIVLTGQDYTTVAGAFAWTIENAAQTGEGPFTFYIDDIVWK